ncbi:non-ribosomal peptide synthetase [Streptomyces tauricus]|uniref:non-ribosomal peptide synthetase n=1 Tax=Streptomyces tauricus TaxID=68274 RepID=UPI002242F324|nr:non-ribosomal peptide synthetase [Streptomyces tauricus]MCW8102057.1 non-ribosomal peptide synthetase [Streptomyces tauricus]
MTDTVPVSTVDTGHRPFPDADRAGTLIHRFLRTAETFPHREAVVTPDVRWTYRRTAELSARVSGALLDAGLRPGDRVGLLFSHGAEMIAALLGALRAGLSYVPLDAAYPLPRLAGMAADAGIRTLVAGPGHMGSAQLITDEQPDPGSGPGSGSGSGPGLGSGSGSGPGLGPVLSYADLARHEPVRDDYLRQEGPLLPDSPLPPHSLPLRGSPARPESEAYVLFTSGSTGRPKPVTQTHRNVLHHTRVWTDGLRVGPLDRLSLQSAYSWDSAVQDTFAALLNGAALYPVDLKALGVTGLLEWLADERVTVYHSTLPVFRALTRAMETRGSRLPAMRMLALGGDTLHLADLDACRRHFEPHCRVAGAYGSTECSCALLWVADPAHRPPTGVFPLGRAVPETEVRLVDDDGRTVHGPGEGELVVVSDYLAPGAAPDGRTYRTGDLARRLDDGTLLLSGRRGTQVKISGIRVEPGEVEAALKQLGQVREAVVAPYTDAMGERQLAAYVVSESGSGLQPAALRAELRRVLPDHAVPTAYVPLRELPLTANHKIDRAALPDPLTATGSARSGPGAPGAVARRATAHGPVEEAVTEAWRDVLGVRAPGPEENFFDLGGTSLRMAAVHERLTRSLAPALRMTDLYRAPTIRALSGLVTRLTAERTGPPSGDAAQGSARGLRRRTARVPRRQAARTAARSEPTVQPTTTQPTTARFTIHPTPPVGDQRRTAPGGTHD